MDKKFVHFSEAAKEISNTYATETDIDIAYEANINLLLKLYREGKIRVRTFASLIEVNIETYHAHEN